MSFLEPWTGTLRQTTSNFTWYYADSAYTYRATTAPHPKPDDACDQAIEGSSTSLASLTLASMMEENQTEGTSSSSLYAGDIKDVDNLNLNPFLQPSSESSFSSSKQSHTTASESSQAGSAAEEKLPTSQSATGSPAVKKLKTSTQAGGVAKQPSTTRWPASVITQAMAVIGMQGYQPAHRWSLPGLPQPPPQELFIQKERVLKLVQERNDGFLLADKVALISIFKEHPAMINTYLGLSDLELCHAWISHTLAKTMIPKN